MFSVLGIRQAERPVDERRPGLVWMQIHLSRVLTDAEQAVARAEGAKDAGSKLPRLMAQLQVIHELLGDVRRELGQ